MLFTGSVNDGIKRVLRRLWKANTALITLAIPQFYIKWVTKLSFVLEKTKFLDCEPFFHYQAKKASSQRAKPLCTLFIFAVKAQLKVMHAHFYLVSGNKLFA